MVGATAVLLAIFAQCLEGQVIQGSVVDRDTGQPITVALVVLLDDEHGAITSVLTDHTGRFVLRPSAPGRYRIRVERIGFRSETAGPIDFSPTEPALILLEIAAEAIQLEGLIVEGEERCRIPRGEGSLIAKVWEEARKALATAVASEESSGSRMRMRDHERTLDVATLSVIERHARTWAGFTRNPYYAASPDELARDGYVRAEADGYRYFGLAAETILSKAFEDTHCFHLRRPGRDQDPAEIGVAFEPLRGRRTPDVSGVLWLDRETAELRRVEYSYTDHLQPLDLPGDRFGGRTDFRRLNSGAWIVASWWIRMPQFERLITSGELPPGTIARGQLVTDAEAHRQLRRAGVSILEVGGTVVSVSEPGAARGTAVLEGTVYDSIAGGPLADAVVYVGGTDLEATTDALGNFRISGLPAGELSVSFHHTRTDEWDMSADPLVVRLTPGDTARLDFAVPSATTLLGARCSAGLEFVFGFIGSDEPGDALAGVPVTAEWTERWRRQGEREFVAEPMARGAITDRTGAYVICDVPSGVPVRVRAQPGDGGRARVAQIVMRSGEARRVDFPFGPTRGPEVGPAGVEAPDLTLEPAVADDAVGEAACEGMAAAGAAAAVVGRVRDAATGVAIGGVSVWLVPDGAGEARTVRADPSGAFAFCDVAAGGYLARVSLRNVGEARQPVTVRPGTATTADLALAPEARANAAGEIAGRVLAAEGRRPLAGAQVRLADGRVHTTGAGGGFAFTDVTAGTVDVTASFLGYHEGTGSVVLGGGQSLRLEILLSPRPFELDPIVVTAVRYGHGGMLDDVRRRAASPWGTVLQGEALERRLQTTTRTVEILREHGADVYGNGTGIMFRRTGCAPHVYVDGVRVTHIPRAGGPHEGTGPSFGGFALASEEAADALNMVHPANITAVEIYRGPAETPGEFLDSDAQCGVVLVWTRRGR